MAKTETPEAAEPKRAVKRSPARKFEAPDMDLAPFGVQVHQEYFIQGVVESAKVRELLDAFGLQEKKEFHFPFQHIKSSGNETWSMRIEPSADHMIDGQHLRGHQWIYKRDSPEIQTGVQ